MCKNYAFIIYVLSALEQNILANGAGLLNGYAVSMTCIQLLDLYGFHRRPAKRSTRSPAVRMLKKIFFQPVIKKDLDVFSVEIQPTSFTWLLQLERISKAFFSPESPFQQRELP
ncbi:hypothetical protein Nepgr_028639 [Nepenthes gracilis]|uniref:Uncharacterized protein n=1 Tax=Nepenthes gracilis TaxID=150966 RepID=A0AAD3TDD7_NEPGR|nr:hypothetical protein Nepgr_028639 [Nepenthes gracilis]